MTGLPEWKQKIIFSFVFFHQHHHHHHFYFFFVVFEFIFGSNDDWCRMMRVCVCIRHQSHILYSIFKCSNNNSSKKKKIFFDPNSKIKTTLTSVYYVIQTVDNQQKKSWFNKGNVDWFFCFVLFSGSFFFLPRTYYITIRRKKTVQPHHHPHSGIFWHWIYFQYKIFSVFSPILIVWLVIFELQLDVSGGGGIFSLFFLLLLLLLFFDCYILV